MPDKTASKILSLSALRKKYRLRKSSVSVKSLVSKRVQIEFHIAVTSLSGLSRRATIQESFPTLTSNQRSQVQTTACIHQSQEKRLSLTTQQSSNCCMSTFRQQKKALQTSKSLSIKNGLIQIHQQNLARKAHTYHLWLERSSEPRTIDEKQNVQTMRVSVQTSSFPTTKRPHLLTESLKVEIKAMQGTLPGDRQWMHCTKIELMDREIQTFLSTCNQHTETYISVSVAISHRH